MDDLDRIIDAAKSVLDAGLDDLTASNSGTATTMAIRATRHHAAAILTGRFDDVPVGELDAEIQLDHTIGGGYRLAAVLYVTRDDNPGGDTDVYRTLGRHGCADESSAVEAARTLASPC